MSNKIIPSNAIEATGLNIQQLGQSEYLGDEVYTEIRENNQGTLTQVYGNDVNSIFLIAQQDLTPNEAQVQILEEIKQALVYVEKSIDPDRFNFTITKATDNEICINRKATNEGRVKIIINDDGVIAFSFLPYKTNLAQKEELNFYSTQDAEMPDFQKIIFKFLSY